MAVPMSAIDIALWDIKGKEENVPVSELLGGRKHDRVLAYATVSLSMTSAVAGDGFDRILRSAVDQGYKAIKLSIENFVRLTQLENVAIAGAEDFILLKDFEKLSDLKAVNILQPDCTRSGHTGPSQTFLNTEPSHWMMKER